MFQPWFIELVSVSSNILVGLSALVVAIIAFIGLKQWKTELTGRTKYEIAKKLAMLSFEYRDRYKQARSPFTFRGESTGRERTDNETREETELLDEYYARRRRLETLQDILRKLSESNWEAEVMISSEITQLIKPLETTFAELFASTEAYFSAELNRIKQHVLTDKKENWLEAHHHRIYGSPTDEISTEIDNSTKMLVDKLKDYLK